MMVDNFDYLEKLLCVFVEEGCNLGFEYKVIEDCIYFERFLELVKMIILIGVVYFYKFF